MIEEQRTRNIQRLKQILPRHLGKLRAALFTVAIATVFSFFLIRAMPGDFLHQRALEIMQQQHIYYPQAYEVAKAQYNYDPDVPLVRQFLFYLGKLARGDLGISMAFRIPVSQILWQALPWTLLLGSLSLSFPIPGSAIFSASPSPPETSPCCKGSCCSPRSRSCWSTGPPTCCTP